MTEQEVVDLMRSSNTVKEWNDNVDRVKAECDGYPCFWYKAIVASKLMAQTMGKGSDQILIKSIIPFNLE